jgi:hypothetical protein
VRNRLVRLALGGAVVALVTAPLTGTSSAMVCAPDFQFVCTTIATVCNASPKVHCPPMG